MPKKRLFQHIPAPRLSVEDPGGWQELPRTPEVKEYSAGFRRLVRRWTPLRILSLITSGYIVWVVIYVIGIAGAGPVATNHERKVALFVSIGWIALICFFVIPMMAMIYRSGWFRVTAKKQGNQPTVYDQDA